MEEDLPTEYDVIVIGTGMTESIAAAAFSRIGKKVLHLDSSDHYGGMWASFNLEHMFKAVEGFREGPRPDVGVYNVVDEWYLNEKIEAVSSETENDDKPDIVDPVINDENEIPLEKQNTSDESNNDTSEKEPEPIVMKNQNIPPQEPAWDRNSLLKEYRKFNIDLAPKLLYARGDLVELLISSNIARYAEFRCVNRVMTWINNRLEPVPCSRADVFATKHVSVVEKRMLMKLLSLLMDYDDSKSAEYYDNEQMKFITFLKNHKLTDNLLHYVLYAIANSTVDTTCKEGIVRCKKFLSSLGRYGNTPFLWSMYGCGELPQGFCRLCAVYGGIYYLNRPIDKITIENPPDSSERVFVHSNGKELKCEHVVVAAHLTPKEFMSDVTFQRGISRAVFVINNTILPANNKEPLTLMKFPPLEGKRNPVTVIELGPSTCSCPKGLYILHMTCKQETNAKDDLSDYAKKLLDFEHCDTIRSEPIQKTPQDTSKKPNVLWCMYFNMTDTNADNLNELTHNNVHICSGPDIELDFDNAIRQARGIFEKICPGAEFLPRTPDPDELVFDGEDTQAGPVFEKDIVKTTSAQNNRDEGTEPKSETENEQKSTSRISDDNSETKESKEEIILEKNDKNYVA